MNSRRLEAETIRDAMLVVGGKFNPKMFGAPVPVMADEDGQIIVGVDTTDTAGRPSGKFVPLNGEEFRRSLYVQVRRSRPLGMLETFDLPRMEPNCELRNASTVAPQSLVMMNGDFTLAQSKFFAERVVREAGAEPTAQVKRAWLLAFGDDPSAEELKESSEFLAAQDRAFQSQAGEARTREPKARKRRPPNRTMQALATFCQALLTVQPVPVRRLIPHEPDSLRLLQPPPFSLDRSGFQPRRASGSPGCSSRTACSPRRRSRSWNARTTICCRSSRSSAPRAKAMISMFMQGGPSHIDLFDPKPELDKTRRPEVSRRGQVRRRRAGQHEGVRQPVEISRSTASAAWRSANCCRTSPSIVDDVMLIRSMQTGVNNHGQSIYALQNGRILGGRPTLGSWLTYGLGSESQDLPAYVALTDPRGLPVLGVDNWTNGWLPSLYQGTVVRANEPRILNLDAAPHLRGEAQANYLGFLDKLNQQHLERHPGETDLEARIASYELAAKLQTAAKEALDISSESEATKKLYGIDDPATEEFGTRCLIARRLVERGVRFVQLFTGNQTWDHHQSILSGLPGGLQIRGQAGRGLVIDLKARGLLDSTVVHWGGEMGRLPVIQNDGPREKMGRDHNTYGFTMWVAGGGFKAGMTYGETDEFGHKAVKDIVNHHDYHATLLHLFGLDHAKLTYKRNGADVSLTDNQGGQVLEKVLI